MDSDDRKFTALMAELAFLQQGIRQVQTQRDTYLGFAVTASIALIGLLATEKIASSAASVLLCGVLLVAIIAAELLTVRCTLDVLLTATYIRLFIERQVAGLEYQSDLNNFELQGGMLSKIFGSRIAYGFAYLLLSIVPIISYCFLASEQTLVGFLAIGLLTVAGVAIAVNLLQMKRGAGWWDPSDRLEKLAEDRLGPATLCQAEN